MPMQYETIRYGVAEGVATLTFNRPKAMNAFDPAMIADTRAAVAAAIEDRAVKVLILTGEGRAFSAGADLAAGGGAPAGMSVGEGVAHSMEIGFNPMARELFGCPKPVIAAVNGVTAGGGVGVALAADIVVAARSAYFVQVFVPALGLIPDVGCTYFLPRLIGHARSRALALLGDRLPAEDAERWGLIWKCVDDEALMDEAHAIAARLSAAGPLAIAQTKRALDQSWHNTLADQLDLEKQIQGGLGDSKDFLEGVSAFLQKRRPTFTGT
ncbi:MAG: enoyl-CoA hydratase-related protein [Alphaproteobacteria bacterium]